MRDSEAFDEVVEECLRRLEAGETVESCLRRFPQHAAALAPLLSAAAELRALPIPQLSHAARNAARARAQAAFARQYRSPRRTMGRWWAPLPVLRVAVALLLAFVLFGASVASAQHSLPGEPLYSVKRATETAQLYLARRPEQKAELYLSFAGRRVDEMLALIPRDKTVDVSMPEEIKIDLTRAREIIDQLPPGDRARLITRYDAQIRGQQAIVAAALPTTESSDDRAVLMAVMRVTQTAAAHRATATSVPTSSTGSMLPTAGMPTSTPVANNVAAPGPQPGPSAAVDHAANRPTSVPARPTGVGPSAGGSKARPSVAAAHPTRVASPQAPAPRATPRGPRPSPEVPTARPAPTKQPRGKPTQQAAPAELPRGKPTQQVDPVEQPRVKPTQQAEPTQQPRGKPQRAPEPTEARTPEPPEVEPTQTPRPTELPEVEPTRAPKPTEPPEVEPTAAPEPTEVEGSKPTRTPKPTPVEIPKPTRTPKPAQAPATPDIPRVKPTGDSGSSDQHKAKP